MATALLSPDTTATPRWLHRWAVFTVLATLVLLFLGALVTTRRAGMADRVWPTYPWHLLLVSWEEPEPGFLIEHSHRAAAYFVGWCTIVLAVGLWRREPRAWLRWLGVAALAGVTLQGLLGGFRIKLHALLGPNLALIHGCFAQVVFALLVSLAVFTSQCWSASSTSSLSVIPAESLALRRWSLTATCLIYLQIVLGAFVRHTYSTLGQRGHLLIAFAVVGVVAWVVKESWERHAEDRILRGAATTLAVLVGLQLLMGVEAWMIRSEVASATHQVMVRTIHVLLGAMILGASVVVTLQSRRAGSLACASQEVVQ